MFSGERGALDQFLHVGVLAAFHLVVDKPFDEADALFGVVGAQVVDEALQP